MVSDRKTFAEIARQHADDENFAFAKASPARIGPRWQNLKTVVRDAQQIESMVAGLASRLKENPDDLNGWVRLIRSYGVLQDKKAATQAYQDASNAFPQNIALMITHARNLRKWAGNQSTATTRTMMQQVVQQDANHFEANWFLGLWAYGQQQFDIAKQHFAIVLSQLDSQDPDNQAMRQHIHPCCNNANIAIIRIKSSDKFWLILGFSIGTAMSTNICASGPGHEKRLTGFAHSCHYCLAKPAGQILLSDVV